MKPDTIAKIVEGAIPLLGGLYAFLLAFRILGKKAGQNPKWDNWHRRYAPTLKILSPLLVAFGIYLMWPALTAVAHPRFWRLNREGMEYMPLERGNRWIYRTYGPKLEMRIVGLERRADIMCARMDSFLDGQLGSSEHFTCLDGDLYHVAINAAIYDPPLRLLQRPDSDQASWTYTSRNGKIRCTTVSHKESAIDLPAGHFSDCVLVESESEVSDGRGTQKVQVWYVKNIGMVKTVIASGDQVTLMELEKFEKAP